MGCCNNNKNCQSNKADTGAAALPKEALAGLNYSAIISSLLEVVKTGLIPSFFKNPAADALAVKIAELVADNRYLRGLLYLSGRELTAVTVDPQHVKISFGPGGSYHMLLPVVTDADRQQLIASLTRTLEVLKKPDARTDTSRQLPLF